MLDVCSIALFCATTAYKHEADPHVQAATNCGMLKRAVGALNILCPSLKFIVFPSGTMVRISPLVQVQMTLKPTNLEGYGIYLPGGHFKAPLVETMDPLPEPYRSEGNRQSQDKQRTQERHSRAPPTNSHQDVNYSKPKEGSGRDKKEVVRHTRREQTPYRSEGSRQPRDYNEDRVEEISRRTRISHRY